MRVFVVDSNDGRRQRLCSALVAVGALPVEAASAAEALRAWRWCSPADAAIVDARLADGAGADVVARLREAQATLPVLYLGGATGDVPPPSRRVPRNPPVESVFAALEEIGVTVTPGLAVPSPELESAFPTCQMSPVAQGLMIVASAEGRVTYLNQVARQLLCLNGSDMPMLSELSDDWAPPFPDGEPRWEVKLALPDGQRISACQTFATVTDPAGSARIVIAVRPLASHCPRLGEVVASERRFRVLLEELHVGVVVQDRDDRILISNPMACELLGITRDQLYGKSSFDPDWHVIREDGTQFDPKDHPSVVAMKQRAPVRDVVMGVYRPRTQDRVWILVSAEPTRNADGELDRVIVTFSDITEYKKLKDELERTHRIKDSSTLAAGLAHDFNNVLFAIIANAECLRLTARDPEGRRRAEEVLAAAQSGAALTRRLLTFARSQPAEPEHVVVDRAVSELVPLLRRTLPATIELTTEFAADDSSVWIDPTDLERAVLNLVVNARDAQPKGGWIRLATRVVPAAEGEGPWLELSVSDGGCGIPEHLRERIFEPLVTTKAGWGGTGLGLAMVHGMVTVAGGAVAVDSSSAGTAVSLRLPLSHSDATTSS